MYEIEKAEGVDCCNTECEFYDKGGMFEQKCTAGYEYDTPYLPHCAGYIPDTKTGEEVTGRIFISGDAIAQYKEWLESKI